MNVEQLDPGERMADDAYAYFMAAWKHKMKGSGYSQKSIAEKTNNSAQWINACLKERIIKKGKVAKASTELQEGICEVFEYSYVDFLQLGRRVLENVPGSQVEQKAKGGPADQQQLSDRTTQQHKPVSNTITPMSIMGDLATLADQYQKIDDRIQKIDNRMRFWREMFEVLPVSALVIRGGVVIYQNTKSRAIGNIAGQPLCENCAGKDCKNPEDCPISVAIETALPGAGYQFIKGQRFKVDIAPLRWHEHEYFIVLATEADNDDTSDRRGGGDRREEPRGE